MNMAKVKIGHVVDFPEGKLKSIMIEGEKILIVKVRGKLYATSSICTHEEGQLEEGELEDYNIKCPLHFAVFDVRDGHVVEAPAERDLKTFKVIIKGRDVFLEL